jgi:hypothetical protein
MSHRLRGLSVVGIVVLLTAARAGDEEGMVANPFYKFWAGSKPGATAVHLEVTKLNGPEGKVLPDGVDEKRITYKLLEVNDKHAVVEMIVREQDFLGFVQAAPTQYIYPAKVKKERLERILQDISKTEEDTLKVADKELKCKSVKGTVKGSNGEQIEYKLWLSDDVPGKIVKQVRSARQKGDTIAETTTTLQSFKHPD